MTKRRDGESLDSMLHRFRAEVNSAGIMSDIKKHEFYRSPAQKRREKSANARKKNAKLARFNRG